MTEPFFSVVTPAYNASAVIARCLDSVAAQTDRSFEILVVDDGSADNTDEVVNAWSQAHPDVALQFFQQENRGPAAARNRGIRVAKGKYICFLDADDGWLPEKLAVIRDHIEASKGRDDIYTHDVIFMERNRERLMECGPERDYREMLQLGNCIITSATVVSRKALFEVELFNDGPVFVGTEDYDLWLKLLRTGRSIALIHQALARYWVMESSLSQNYEMVSSSHRTVVQYHLAGFDLTEAEKARFLRFSDYTMYHNIGRRLQVEGNHKQANGYFRKALRNNPFSIKTAICCIGNCLGLEMRNPLRKNLSQ